MDGKRARATSGCGRTTQLRDARPVSLQFYTGLSAFGPVAYWPHLTCDTHKAVIAARVSRRSGFVHQWRRSRYSEYLPKVAIRRHVVLARDSGPKPRVLYL